MADYDGLFFRLTPTSLLMEPRQNEPGPGWRPLALACVLPALSLLWRHLALARRYGGVGRAGRCFCRGSSSQTKSTLTNGSEGAT